jgi:hypothetical protein
LRASASRSIFGVTILLKPITVHLIPIFLHANALAR